jgi:AcrR family transcriptional regulator
MQLSSGSESPTVRRRRYDSRSRRSAAQATRRSILKAARRAFLERGYAGATMPAIAEGAGVALDTVYAVVGRKPTLFKLLVETAISGSDRAVPAEERDYVRAVRAEPKAERKLEIYAAAIRAIHLRLAPLFRVLRDAAPLERELDDLWREISQRRAANMRLFAENLATTGRLRSDLSVDVAADILWSMNGPEFYLLLVEERGWSPEAFEQWLAEAWRRLLLDN